MTARGWFCEAYGGDVPSMTELCFVEAAAGRCPDRETCGAKMQAERQRVFDVIQTGAAAGDPDMAYLAGEFTSPDQLLNAEPDDDPPAT